MLFIYNETLMNEIIQQYSGCLTELESLMKLMKEVERNLETNYSGKAEQGLEPLFNTLKKHLDTYEECIFTTKNYVAYAIESAILLDKLLFKIRRNHIKRKSLMGVPER